MAADVVIVFCGGLRGEELFLTPMKVVLKFWEETIKKKDLSRIMVILKGWFKGKRQERSGTCFCYYIS